MKLKFNIGLLYCLAYSLFLSGDILVYLASSKSLDYLGLENVHLYYLTIPLVYYTITALSSYLFDKFVSEFDKTNLLVILITICLLTNILFLLTPWDNIKVWMSLLLIVVGGAITGPAYIALDSAMDKRISKEDKAKVISKRYYWSGLFGFSCFILSYLYLDTSFNVKLVVFLSCFIYISFILLFIILKSNKIIKRESIIKEVSSEETKSIYNGVKTLFIIFSIFSILVHLADPIQTLQIKLLLNLSHENQFIYGSFYYIGSIIGSVLTTKIMNKVKNVIWIYIMFIVIGLYFVSMISDKVIIGVLLYSMLVSLSTVFKVFTRNYVHTVFSGRLLETWLARIDIVYNLSTFITVVGVMLLSYRGSYMFTWSISILFCIILIGVALPLSSKFYRINKVN